MDEEFNVFLQDFVVLYKTDIFNNISKCKSLLLDHAKGEFKKEIRLLLQALDISCHNTIKNSNDLNITRIYLINQMKNEYFISEEIAVSLIDLLLSVIRGYIPPKNETDAGKQQTKKEIVQSPILQTTIHDYEKEAKAERLYQTALNCFFKDINNNLTLAIDSIIKAIKINYNDKRFHFYLSYCFFKVNDLNNLRHEMFILKELNYADSLLSIISEDIFSTRSGKIASRLYNAFKRGGERQLEAAKSSIYSSSKITYAESAKIFNKYMDFINWAEKFDKELRCTH